MQIQVRLRDAKGAWSQDVLIDAAGDLEVARRTGPVVAPVIGDPDQGETPGSQEPAHAGQGRAQAARRHAVGTVAGGLSFARCDLRSYRCVVTGLEWPRSADTMSTSVPARR